ncbi:MAG: filamentous hemagglutinin N-terminal domain-containing protein, partial [Aquabacterium sp.]
MTARHRPVQPPALSALSCALLAAGLLASAAGGVQAAPPVPRAATLAPRQALPVRAVDPQRRAGDVGQFTIATPQAQQMVVSQQSSRAIINWDSFNVAAGHQVRFDQPDKGSTLNRIWDADPSVIAGQIRANGEVLLQNTNGLILGPTARVDTGRFVATALRVAEDAYLKGLRGITDGSPALQANADERHGFVSIERGAEVRAAAGGDVLVFAPRVINAGRIETPDGQTVLGAGQTVYLSASADPAQRGLIVGIRPFATGDADLNRVVQAEAGTYRTLNGATVPDGTTTAGVVERVNAVVAERGSINLVGLAIQQSGLLQATTAVKGRNGVILLQAQADVNPLAEVSIGGRFVNVPVATALGRVDIGPLSRTEVLPSQDNTQTQFDSEAFLRSQIRVEGERIQIRAGAVLRAPSGRIDLLASDRPDRSLAFNPNSFDLSSHAADPSRVVVESGAVLDVAGLKGVALPMSRHQMSGRLFQIELADAPVQRDGPLYREEVFFDARKTLRVANVSGFYNTIARSASELSTAGGQVNIQSDGAIAVDVGARVDISGGSIRYDAGEIRTSLLRDGATWITLDRADAAVRYAELGNSKARLDAGQALFKVERHDAYQEGRSAGTATLAGRLVYMGGAVQAEVIIGERQSGRTGTTAPATGTLVFGRQRQSDSSLSSLALQLGPPRRRPAALFDDPMDGATDGVIAPTLVLSTGLLQTSGVGQVAAYMSGQFLMSEGASLDLGTAGSLKVEALRARLDGVVRTPGGTVSILTQGAADQERDIRLGARAVLDVSGQWLVDTATTPAALDTAAVSIGHNGGTITLGAAGSLVAASGARLDVSAGARRLATTTVTGRAGAISLGLNQGADVVQGLPGRFDQWQATLAGFDFDRGGALSISGLPSLTLGGTASTLDLARLDAGFGSIALSTLGDVRLTSELDWRLTLRNLVSFVAQGQTDALGRFAGPSL